MPLVRIQSATDPRVGAYRNLGDRELMVRWGLFVAEGRLIVRRVIESGRFAVRSLLLSHASHHALESDLSVLPADVPVYVCDVELFASLTGFNLHRGCLALVERPPRRAAVEVVQYARTVVIMDTVANPDNVGGVFRSAAAFGVDAVLLSPGCCDPWYRKAIRTSMGASLFVPFSVVEPWPLALRALREDGFSLVALTLSDESVPLDEYLVAERPGRIAVMIGAEGYGLGTEAEALADRRVRIPMPGRVDSLNLSVAAGIALWALLGLTPGRGG